MTTISDTLSGRAVEVPAGEVRVYLCGVTVYDDAHIGHARTIVIFDVLRRHLESTGHQVRFVQNFTDVDDKIIDRARAEGEDALQLGARYIARYHEDFDRLNVKRAAAYPQATTHIDRMISLIETLVRGGHAYAVASGVYYSVESFPQYGRLSKKDIGEMMAGTRIEPAEDKRNPMDFALWKRADAGPCWDSPWGRGRPGWHIECSAMSLEYLGEDFEIHGGGRDLVFPHHENEIAQTEGCTRRRLARIWMHTGMVTISGQKMSKSLGNIRSARALLDAWGPNVIRLFCLSGHYQKPIDYSERLLGESLALWRRLETCHHTLDQTRGADDDEGGAVPASRWRAAFEEALSSDLNTHAAITAMMDMARESGEMASRNLLSPAGAAQMASDLSRMISVLGLRIAGIPAERTRDIRRRVSLRADLRRAGEYARADEVRAGLQEEGVELLDYGGRTIWVHHELVRGEVGTI